MLQQTYFPMDEGPCDLPAKWQPTLPAWLARVDLTEELPDFYSAIKHEMKR